MSEPGPTDGAPETPASIAPPSPADESQSAPAKQRWFRLRSDIPVWMSVALSFLTIVMLFGVWWFLTNGEEASDRILSPTKMPSPYEVYQKFPKDLWNSEFPERHLVSNTLTTLKRVCLGFLLATVIGVPLGVLAGCFRPFEALMFPLIIFGRNIPIAALTMLTFLLFGIEEFQKVMFIFIACSAFVIADSTQAIKDVAQRYVDTSYTLGAGRWQAIYKVLVPLALPNIFNSLRLLFGLAFGYIMLAELVTIGEEVGGLGHLINVGQRRGMQERIYAIVLVIPLVAFCIDYCLYLLQCILFPYRYGAENRNNIFLRALRAIGRVFWKPSQPALAGAGNSPEASA